MMMRNPMLAFLLVVGASSAMAQLRDKCHEPSEHTVIEQCGWERFDQTEAELNTTYKRLYAELKERKDELRRLVSAQKSWLQYRQLTCEFWDSRVKFNVPYCMIKLTQNRIDEIVHMYECESEGGGKC